MGRKTLESFPGGRPLKDRRNVVLTRDASFSCEGVETASSVEDSLALLSGEPTVWVIGGGEVYRQLVPLCEEAVVTRNHVVRPVDTRFPDLDADPVWELAEVTPGEVIADGEGDAGVRYDFATYRRVS